MQEVALHSLTNTSPVLWKIRKEFSTKKKIFVLEKSGTREGLLAVSPRITFIPVLKLRLETMEAFVQSACK